MKPALSYFMIQIAKHLSSIYILIESGSDYEGKRIVEVQKTQSQRQMVHHQGYHFKNCL